MRATLGLARALTPLIRVNAVCPGYTDTPWWVKGVGQDAADRLRDVVKAGVPLRVASTAEDIAAVVTFLADPGVASHDRVVVPVDAGFRLLVSQSPHQTPGAEPLHGVRGWVLPRG